jgi:hypothetical protein
MEILTDQQKAIDAAPPASTGSTPKQAQMQTQLQRSFLVEADGSVTEGPDLEVLPANDAHESGATVDVTYEGAGGRSFAAKGRVRSIAGAGSRLVVVPQEPAFAATRARLSGIGVSKLTARTLGH